MSRENLELVRKTVELFGAGGTEALLACYATDVIVYSVPGWVEDPVYRGHDGIRRLMALWTENFDDIAFDLHEIRESQERVLALFELTGSIKGSGVPIRQPFGAVSADFRDGRIGEIRFFLGWDDALKAVGLALGS
jgi:ketosteroid isomerase-like protein